MKLFWKIFIVIVLVIIAALGVRFLSGPEDDWLCQNGRWIKHGNPSAPQPTATCGDQSDLIVVDSPQPNDIVVSPLMITGRARGNWFFEASSPIELVDEKGEVIAQTVAQAKSDWMTTEFVPFAATLTFPAEVCLGLAYPCSAPAKLIFKKDNPSGLPQYDAQMEIPVNISEGSAAAVSAKVKVFFSNNDLDKEITCNKVFAVEREIIETPAVARAALEELLKGPSEEDKAQGFYTSINPGVKLQKLTITDGIARVDFDATIEQGVGGSCRVSAIRAEIVETLKQFATVNDVVISINGRTEDILQP